MPTTEEPTISRQSEPLLSILEDAFPHAAQPAEYRGIAVTPDRLVDVATFLRDELGYTYLSCVTAVDYPRPTPRFPARYEVVYNLFLGQKGPVSLHVHADRTEPTIPSLTNVWPSANFQEREAWDLLGIRFSGHPDHRRILLWEGFHGHPLRKDWHEPYYEEDQKPFSSRFPDGKPVRAEERTALGRNVDFPPGWSTQTWQPTDEAQVYKLSDAYIASDQCAMGTEEVVLNMGPQHPGTHGVLRLVACLDGETILRIEPNLGYLHRCHEKIGERNTWLGNMPYTDRLDYICSMYNNFGYAMAVEKLAGIEVPERTEYIRVIMGELTRVMNHFVSIGAFCNDMGIYFTAMLYGLTERELIIDLFEQVSGSRMMCNYFRFGGVAKDLPDEFVPMARELVFECFPRRIDEMETCLLDNEVFCARTTDTSVLPPEAAVAYGCTGPPLRGSGVPYDVRRAEPYSIYHEFDWDVVVHNNGDVIDRVLVRFSEMRESLRILRQALDRLPDGPIQDVRVRSNTRIPQGEAYGRVEHPKGELGFYLVSDGGKNPYRYHIRTASFVNLGVLGELCRGNKIAHIVATLGSIDSTLGEVDR